MKAVNEASMLVAQALQELNFFKEGSCSPEEDKEIIDKAFKLLESALDKLAADMV